MSQILSRDNLRSWLSSLMQSKTVIAPATVEDTVLFRPASKVEEIIFDYQNSLLPPKQWFFPITDTLFTIERKDGNTELVPLVMGKEAILLGIRPCDAHGMSVLDNVFLGEPSDANYGQRRAKTTLVGLGCKEACPASFCASMGGGPHDPSHLDILLTEVPEGFLVKAVTEKGKTLLTSATVTETATQSPAPPDTGAVPVGGITEVMLPLFNNEYWGRLADRCIGCQICTYVCPTCHCFDIRDYSEKDKVERIRTWDGCQSKLFNQIAGGYNPRPTKEARLRQRFFHKLVYFPQEYEKVIACVGCGRCVVRCPVNIDIREIISDMQKLGVKSVLSKA